MTTADEIMAEALKNTGNGQDPAYVRPQPGEDLSISPSPQAGASPEPTGIRLTPEQLRARRSRSIAIALALGAFVLVIFAVTIVRLGSAALTGPDYMRPVQATQ
jgi:hypothetical protein